MRPSRCTPVWVEGQPDPSCLSKLTRWGWFLRLQNFLQENYKMGKSKKKEVERGAGVSLDEDDRLVRTKDGWVRVGVNKESKWQIASASGCLLLWCMQVLLYTLALTWRFSTWRVGDERDRYKLLLSGTESLKHDVSVLLLRRCDRRHMTLFIILPDTPDVLFHKFRTYISNREGEALSKKTWFKESCVDCIPSRPIRFLHCLLSELQWANSMRLPIPEERHLMCVTAP